ncbi:AraC family transcriptional regulator [Bordetella genomosp. 10]|uniref:AraC family transcriptional regulator n=1 Tax=Bordetella genomosp. 10 TaxID=1416804 RepID=A0A261SBF6_9BORD|nr:helix-turn-helix transcriptional regulator [Bordetella genomosp. 10]OZI34327.1 AraC family transcriptional regulator [Bordetella genomosp. 10]
MPPRPRPVPRLALATAASSEGVLLGPLKIFEESPRLGPVFGVRVRAADHRAEVPTHRHPQGQLVVALRGGVVCEVPDGVWMVPPACAVWVPSELPHSIRATANARMGYLFVQPGAADLPGHCCTLAISPLARELVLRLADLPSEYEADSATGRLAVVLLEELARMPRERLRLPTSAEPRLRRIAKMLSEDPADRRTLAEWAKVVATSERTLARLVRQETGLTFGRWRQQLHLIVALHQLSAGQSVQRVAEALGYDSVTAFISMFKKSLGKPPGKYFAGIARRDDVDEDEDAAPIPPAPAPTGRHAPRG